MIFDKNSPLLHKIYIVPNYIVNVKKNLLYAKINFWNTGQHLI